MRAPALALTLVLAAVACGGKSAPPPVAPSNQPSAAPTPEPAPLAAQPSAEDAAFEALMQRALSMFAAMGTAADAAAGDCNKLADRLDVVMNDHQDFIAQAKLYKDNPEMKQRAQAWMKTHTDEMMQPMIKLGTAAQKCVGTPKFDATMKRFEELGS